MEQPWLRAISLICQLDTRKMIMGLLSIYLLTMDNHSYPLLEYPVHQKNYQFWVDITCYQWAIHSAPSELGRSMSHWECPRDICGQVWEIRHSPTPNLGMAAWGFRGDQQTWAAKTSKPIINLPSSNHYISTYVWWLIYSSLYYGPNLQFLVI